MLALRPPFFAFTLFSPFVLSRFFSFFFSAPFPLGPSLFSPPILCPFPGCVFYPRLSAPFSLSLTGFPLLRFPSCSSPPFHISFPPSLLRFLFFRPSAFSPSCIFPLPFSPFLSVSLVPSPFYSSFSPSPLLLSAPVRFPLFSALPSPTPSLLRPRTFPSLCPPGFFRSLPPLSLFLARPVDRARLLCYNTFR